MTTLVRGVGLRGATAINVITMVGIGPLITIPLVLAALHGPLSLVAWIAGALIALCDGLVWAELGSLFPGSGGTYGFLRATFGAQGVRALPAFLFAWQTIFAAPLLLASGYIGFADYAAYLVPGGLGPWPTKLLAVAIGVVTLLALARGIGAIARTGIVLGAGVVVTLLCVIVAAYAHPTVAQPFALGAGDSLWGGLRTGLGAALILTMYDYLGYGQAACIGDELVEPRRTLPRATVLAVLLVAVLYVALQIGVLRALPWAAVVADPSGLGQHVGSTIVEHAAGVGAAIVVTVLILVTTFASVYGNLLGFSRIPFAAARDGLFPRVFAHVQRRHRFPDVSLVTIGVLALPACLFPLDQVIAALTTAIVLVQAIAQIVALAVLRARGERAPYSMPLYPLPALVALAGWLYAFASAGGAAIGYGLVSIAAGVAVFWWRGNHTRPEWL
ncbi:MAG TPA: APC family permease [Candidatus Sulfotelmatobacter sp.]|nr:APC family permease [Candidatus Sulfotelmatobacter sp.]